MSDDNNDKGIEVESSAVKAAKIIAKEKKKKADTLKAIFDDNTTGRYSGPTDN